MDLDLGDLSQVSSKSKAKDCVDDGTCYGQQEDTVCPEDAKKIGNAIAHAVKKEKAKLDDKLGKLEG
jgi:hypothetical protein